MLYPAVIAVMLAASIAVSTFLPSDETLRMAFDRGQRFYVLDDFRQAIGEFEIVKDAEDSRFVDETHVMIRVGQLDFPVKVAATYQMANSYRNLAVLRLEEADRQAEAQSADTLRAQSREYFARAGRYYDEAGSSTDLLEIRVLSSYQSVKTRFEAKDYPGVIGAGRELIEAFPESDYVDEALYEMGWAHYNMGNYEQAIEAFSALSDKTTAGYRVDRAQFQIGKSLFDLTRYGEARGVLGKLVSRYGFGRLSESDRVKMEAEKLTGVVKETALELAAKAQILIGDTYSVEGNLDSAVAAYQRVLRDYAQKRELVEDAYVKIGEAHFAQGDIDGGVWVYRQAIEAMTPRDFRARMQARIARRYYDSGQFGKALNEYGIYLQAYGELGQQGELDQDRARFQMAQCLFEMAEEQRRQGEASSAHETYARAKEAYLEVSAAVRRTPLAADALYGAALAAQRRGAEGDLEEAVGLYTRLQKEYPERPDLVAVAALQTARARYEQRAYPAAVELYRVYLTQLAGEQGREQVQLELALAYREAGRPEEAVTVLRELPAASAGAAKAGLLEGELLLRLGRLDEAQVALERGLSAAVPGVETSDLLYVLARVQFEQGRRQEAVETFGRVLADSTKEAVRHGSLLGRGTAYYQMGDYASATRDLEELLRLSPPQSVKDQAYRVLGQAYVRAGRHTEAIEAYKAIMEATTDPQEKAEFALLLAELYYGLGRYQEAIEQGRRVIAAQIEDDAAERGHQLKARAYAVTGEALSRLDDHVEARRTYTEGLGRYPDSSVRADLVFGEAVAAFALEDYQDVGSRLGGFAADYPESPNLENAIYFLAYASLRLGDLEAAAKWFGELASRYPRSEVAAEALYQRGESLFNLSRFDEAAAAFAALAERHAESDLADNSLYNLAWCYFELDRKEEAVAQFQALLARFPDGPLAPSAQFTVGDYYFNEKAYAQSEVAYRAVVERYPGSAVAAQSQELLSELRDIRAYTEYEAAMVLYDARDFAAASKALRKVVDSYPGTRSQAGAMANLGMSYEMMHEWEEAAQVYRGLLEAHTGNPGSSSAVAFAKEHLDWIVENKL